MDSFLLHTIKPLLVSKRIEKIFILDTKCDLVALLLKIVLLLNLKEK